MSLEPCVREASNETGSRSLSRSGGFPAIGWLLEEDGSWKRLEVLEFLAGKFPPTFRFLAGKLVSDFPPPSVDVEACQRTRLDYSYHTLEIRDT